MNLLQNLSLRNKLMIPILLVSVILLIISLLGITRLSQIDSKLKAITSIEMPRLYHLLEVDREIHRALVAERSAMFVDVGSDKFQALMAQHREGIDAARRSIDKYRSLAKSGLESRQVDDLTGMFTAWAQMTDEILTLRTADTREKRAAAFDLSFGKAIGEFDAMRSMLDEMTSRAFLEAEAQRNSSEKIVDASTRLMLIAGAIGLLICALVITLFPRLIVGRLKGLLERLRDIANGEGDLTRRLDESGRDELSELAKAFNSFAEKIRAVIAEVMHSAQTMAISSDEISRGNSDLSSRTAAQAASLEETSSSMEEMTSIVQQNAENAERANALADAARHQATSGGAVATDAVAAMGEINRSSERIADIISVIDGIAFQTNLLALNAAVEAARAGDQGRGFAVVASEVRALAQRSAVAAKEIKALIAESVQRIGTGTELVNKCGGVLSEIRDSVKAVSDIVVEITSASKEQAAGINQVNKAVLQMDQKVQQDAAMVEEMAAASEALSNQSQALNRLVSFFKVKDAAPTDADLPVNVHPIHPRGRDELRATGSNSRAELVENSGGQTWSEH